MYGEISHKTKTTVNPQLVSYNTPPYATGVGAYYWMHTPFPASVTTSKVIDINGQMAATPWIVPNSITLTQIGIDVTSVTGVDAGGVLRFGIWTDSGSYTPFSLIRDLGTVAADAVSVTNPSFVAAFSLNLQPGIYWVTLATQGCATARPTVGTITTAGLITNTLTTTSSSRAIPATGGVSRSWFAWTPSTSPAFTLVTTSLIVAPQWGGGLTTGSSGYPRFVIRIA